MSDINSNEVTAEETLEDLGQSQEVADVVDALTDEQIDLASC
jgi:hypothetical protein